MNDLAETPLPALDIALGQIERLKNDLAEARAALESERLLRRQLAERLEREFRLPLEAMLGFSQLLKASGPGNSESLEKNPASGDRPAPESDPIAPAAPRERNAAASPGRLLYIEDQMTNVQMVEIMLNRSLGIILTSAENGRLGIERARADQPDLILLDLNLPDMHGTEVIRALQEHPETASIPVVIVSGDAAPSQIDRLLAAGARDYLVKPFKMDRLKSAVETLLREARPAA